MITGTVGVSPVRLLSPGAARRGPHGEPAPQARSTGDEATTGPSVYLVRVEGSRGCVDGLVVAVDVQDPPAVGGLLPHEETDHRAVRRRLRVLRTARLDRDPVMLTYRGGGEAVTLARQDARLLTTSTHHGVTATVSAVGADTTSEVLRSAGEQRYLVADGHHRLAATVELVRAGRPSSVTGFLVDADDTPLSLGAIHRVVLDRNGRELVGDAVVASALEALRSSGGEVDGPTPSRGEHAATAASGQVVLLHGTSSWSVTWPGRGDLDIAWLAERAVEQLPDTRIRREPDARAGVAAAERGALTVLLPALRLDEVIDAASHGLLLPYKTTLFEPKLPSGVLVRPVAES